jgi:predicted dehydrogenase
MNVGVVGCGYWGPNLIRNFYENKNCDRVSCCDVDAAKLQKMKTRYSAITVYSNFDEFLSDENLDAVAIATPISTHFPLAKSALLAGKHTFVEKPLTATAQEARELIEIAEANSLVLMVGHTFEYSPPVIKIKELIDKGELGKIHFISSTRVNLGLHQKDVSVIWDLAPHDFSILFNWLEETPTHVSTIGSAYVQKGIPDVAFINMKFASGAIAHVQISWLAPSKLRRTTVIGSEKMLVYDDTEVTEKVKIYDKGVNYKDPETFGEYQLSYRSGDILSPRLDSFEPLATEIGHFVECIQMKKEPRTGGKSGLRVVQALEAAERSLNNEGAMEEIRD